MLIDPACKALREELKLYGLTFSRWENIEYMTPCGIQRCPSQSRSYK